MQSDGKIKYIPTKALRFSEAATWAPPATLDETSPLPGAETTQGEVEGEQGEQYETAPFQRTNTLTRVLLQERVDPEGRRVRCNLCQRRCNIPEGKIGYCKTKVNFGGVVYDTIYGVVSGAASDPIEKKPINHYRPGTKVFTTGSLGCNFRCKFCQNWGISYESGVGKEGQLPEPNVLPEEYVRLALANNCQGVAWSYNDPSIWLEYTLPCAKLAHEAGLYTCYVTNGFSTPEHIDMIAPHLDIYRVDIKSADSEFYRKLAHVPHAEGILEVTSYVKHRYNPHIECVTNVVPGWNDSEENLRNTAIWIRDNLGPLTPWHITRFFPHAEMMDTPPTPIPTLKKGQKIGLEEGLRFVYVGNVPDERNDTLCYNCGTTLVERRVYATTVTGPIKDGRCGNCGVDVNMVV